jgi:hypothetical protein
MSTEKKFDPRLREGDRVRLVQDVEAERRTYRVGELATIFELPSHSKELVDSWELMDMYDIICDEGGIVGVLSKSIERVPGRSTVQYGPDGEVSVQLPDLASMGHGAIALKDGDRVELVTDIKVGGTPHSVGTAGFVVIKDLGPGDR